MKYLQASIENIRKAAAVIREGGLVAFPTETVYGLGANATDPEAVARIFEVKKRPYFDPLIVHLSSVSDLSGVAVSVPDTARILIERFWPGPLTLIFEKTSNIADIVTSGLPTVAVRMPDHPVAHKLIELAGVPVTAPSANPFSYLSPTTADHVFEQLGNDVDMILDGGACPVGVESTIVNIVEDEVFLLRPGGLPVSDIEHCLGRKVNNHHLEGNPLSPGQLPFHYSPDTGLIIVDSVDDMDFSNPDAVFLFFKDIPDIPLPEKRYRVLSPSGNMREAAARLFSMLHELDSMKSGLIIAQRVPEHGLGAAIMDRLTKASKKIAGKKYER